MRAIGIQLSRRLFCSAMRNGGPHKTTSSFVNADAVGVNSDTTTSASANTNNLSGLFSKSELDEIFKPELTLQIKS